MNISNVPLLVVGNKVDLRNNGKVVEELKTRGLKPISHEEGESMATKIGAKNYIECTVFSQELLSKLFHNAIREAFIHKRNKFTRHRRTKCWIL